MPPSPASEAHPAGMNHQLRTDGVSGRVPEQQADARHRAPPRNTRPRPAPRRPGHPPVMAEAVSSKPRPAESARPAHGRKRAAGIVFNPSTPKSGPTARLPPPLQRGRKPGRGVFSMNSPLRSRLPRGALSHSATTTGVGVARWVGGPVGMQAHVWTARLSCAHFHPTHRLGADACAGGSSLWASGGSLRESRVAPRC